MILSGTDNFYCKQLSNKFLDIIYDHSTNWSETLKEDLENYLNSDEAEDKFCALNDFFDDLDELGFILEMLTPDLEHSDEHMDVVMTEISPENLSKLEIKLRKFLDRKIEIDSSKIIGDFWIGFIGDDNIDKLSKYFGLTALYKQNSNSVELYKDEMLQFKMSLSDLKNNFNVRRAIQTHIQITTNKITEHVNSLRGKILESLDS